MDLSLKASICTCASSLCVFFSQFLVITLGLFLAASLNMLAHWYDATTVTKKNIGTPVNMQPSTEEESPLLRQGFQRVVLTLKKNIGTPTEV